jgi:surfactin family lipopeptide synthetase A
MPTATPLSGTKRALLDKYLQGMGSHPTGTIHRRPPGSVAPLSVAQEELYRRELRVAGIPPLYNECVTLRMVGPLDVVALEEAFSEIIKRHETWRTTFEIRGGHPTQVVHSAMSLPFPVIDLRGSPEAEREATVVRLVGEDVRRPFDLSRGPLLRAKMARMNETEYRLFLIAHQIILDGVSAYQVFPSELAAFYKGFLIGRPATLPELPIQCGDFACWQQEWLSGAAVKQVDYWRTRLGGEVPALAWPVKSKPATRGFRGSIQSFSFGRSVSDHIKQLARRLGTTLFLVLAAGLATLLHRYTNQEEIILGTLSPSGRKRSEVMGLLGYFLNPVAVKLNFHDGITFRELVLQVQRVLLDAMCNDDVPIERLARELKGSDDSSPGPFFTAAISLQPPMPELGLPWSVTSMDVESGGSPWDFYLAFIDRPEGLIGRAQFNTDLFDNTTIGSALQDLQEVLGDVSLESVVTSARIRRDDEGATSIAGGKGSAV